MVIWKLAKHCIQRCPLLNALYTMYVISVYTIWVGVTALQESNTFEK